VPSRRKRIPCRPPPKGKRNWLTELENHTSVVTVELDDADCGTELRLVHEQLPNEESRDGHSAGWNSALDKLEKFFGK